MKTALIFLTMSAGLVAGQAARPAITGISHMCVYASDMNASDHFYGHVLGGVKGGDAVAADGVRYYFSPLQFVEVLPLPAQHTISRMACVAFQTADAKGLREYLRAQAGLNGVGELQTASDGSRWFAMNDPEGNRVEFVQAGSDLMKMPGDAKPIGTRMIHVGYLAHNRADEDKFYKDVLGFRPYWFGSKQPDHVDWVSQQTPDGHGLAGIHDGGRWFDGCNCREWIERQLGVLNHFSIGVENMEKAVTTLWLEDRLSQRHDGPSMGLDGKWQANLYDPDGTRVELMEFQPVASRAAPPLRPTARYIEDYYGRTQRLFDVRV